MITIILLDLWETLATKKLKIFDTLCQDYSVSSDAFPFFKDQLLKLDAAEINEDEFWNNLRSETRIDILGRESRLIDIYRKITIINEELLNAALDFQAHGGRIAIFSNTDSAARDYLKEIGVLDKFDTSFFSFDAKLSKPDKKFIDLVLTTMDVQAQNIAYFDDNPSCIKAANEAGINGYVYKELADARLLIEQFSQTIAKNV